MRAPRIISRSQKGGSRLNTWLKAKLGKKKREKDYNQNISFPLGTCNIPCTAGHRQRPGESDYVSVKKKDRGGRKKKLQSWKAYGPNHKRLQLHGRGLGKTWFPAFRGKTVGEPVFMPDHAIGSKRKGAEGERNGEWDRIPAEKGCYRDPRRKWRVEKGRTTAKDFARGTNGSEGPRSAKKNGGQCPWGGVEAVSRTRPFLRQGTTPLSLKRDFCRAGGNKRGGKTLSRVN